MTEVVKRLLEGLPGGYWLDSLEDIRRRTIGVTLDDKDFDFLVEEMAMLLGRNHPGRTTNMLLLGLLADEERFLKTVRIKGVLRPSKYDLRGNLISDSVTPIIERADKLGISQSSRQYLTSLHALSIVANGARGLRYRILNSIPDGRMIKSVLVAIDSLFLTGHEAKPGQFPPNEWQHHSKEALAEGFSVGLYLYRSAGRPLPEKEIGGPVHPGILTTDKYKNLLAECAIFRSFYEWEFEIDVGTHFANIDRGTVYLHPTSERVEKATTLGFISVEQSRVKAATKNKPEDAASLATLANKLHEALKQSGRLRIVSQPFRRLVLEFPEVPQLVDILKDDAFFGEEVAYLDYSRTSFLMAPGELTSFVVFGHVTVHDLMKVSRVVNLLRQILRLEIVELWSTEPETAAQSILPILHRDMWMALLSAVVSKEKAEELLNFWEWTGEGLFDLQYQPFVRSGTHYAVPLNVFGDSDVIRNALQLARVRIHHQDDPSEHTLANAFAARSVPAVHGVEYNFNGQDGEIDVLAVLDGIAFAFECKNSLLPANPFELRQTLTYLYRANQQLDRLRNFWRAQSFVEMLRKKAGLELLPGMPLVTCAVTVNRMLSGSIFGSHPVRGLFELGSFLHQGGIEILGQKVRVVEGAKVSGEDLRAYIEGDSLHGRILSAMVPHDWIYAVGGVQVVRRTYGLSLPLLAKEFGLKIPEEFLRSEDKTATSKTGVGNSSAGLQAPKLPIGRMLLADFSGQSQRAHNRSL